MKHLAHAAVGLAVALSLPALAADKPAPKAKAPVAEKELSGPPGKEELAASIKSLKERPELKKFFTEAFGFALFPRVGRGALGIGGAYGDGAVFNKAGKEIATTTLTQVTIGLGAGGEQYTEVIFFKDKPAFSQFESGKVEMDAHATAVAAQTGVGGEAAYNNGVAIFTFTKGGLIADASIGGQKFSYAALGHEKP
jgi:lipid-binding SYLF domain-containing protein